MYSVVLMMALSSGAEMPAAHGKCNKCCGCSCYGCCGCYSCNGCHSSKGCKGCKGCHSCHSCYGCCGCYSCCGGCCGCHVACCGGCCGCCGGVVVVPAAKPAEPIAPPKKSEVPAPATIVVSLPADAKLLIDDTATTSTSATRAFASPILELGKDYFYTLKAEVVRDGKSQSTTKRIAVRAGEETTVTLEFSEVAVAQR